MKPKHLKINYLEFDDHKQASENKNYPHSGLFIARVNDDTSDLRFVDKSVQKNVCIVPESVFNSIAHESEVAELEYTATIDTSQIKGEPEALQFGKTDNNFILEFSKILLSKK